jgi:hypothetical protein
MITLSWLLIVTVLAAGLSLFDGITRMRGKGNTILAVAELVFAALMLLSIFIAFPPPFTTLLFAIILEVVLVLTLVLRAGRRGGSTLTIIALILNTVVVLIAIGWLTIPGLG